MTKNYVIVPQQAGAFDVPAIAIRVPYAVDGKTVEAEVRTDAAALRGAAARRRRGSRLLHRHPLVPADAAGGAGEARVAQGRRRADAADHAARDRFRADAAAGADVRRDRRARALSGGAGAGRAGRRARRGRAWRRAPMPSRMCSRSRDITACPACASAGSTRDNRRCAGPKRPSLRSTWRRIPRRSRRTARRPSRRRRRRHVRASAAAMAGGRRARNRGAARGRADMATRAAGATAPARGAGAARRKRSDGVPSPAPRAPGGRGVGDTRGADGLDGRRCRPTIRAPHSAHSSRRTATKRWLRRSRRSIAGSTRNGRGTRRHGRRRRSNADWSRRAVACCAHGAAARQPRPICRRSIRRRCDDDRDCRAASAWRVSASAGAPCPRRTGSGAPARRAARCP